METTQDPKNSVDMLIGMDIIGKGDFAITNNNDKTVMSFMVPSHERIDFEPVSEKLNNEVAQ